MPWRCLAQDHRSTSCPAEGTLLLDTLAVCHPSQINIPVPVGEFIEAFTLGEEGLEGLAGVQ